MHISLSALIICFAMPSFSQSQRNFVSLTKGKNLEYANFNSIQEDHLGFIWLSSRNGLFKYDGYDLTLIPFRDILSQKFKIERSPFSFVDNENKVWISLFNGKLIKIENPDVFLTPGNSAAIPAINQQISYTALVNNGIWIGSEKGTLYYFNDITRSIDSLTTLPILDKSNSRINSIIPVNDKTIFLSTEGGKIFSYNRSSSESIELQSFSLSVKLIKTQIGEVWAFINGEGIFIYDIAKNRLRKFESESFDPGKFKKLLFYRLYEQNDGTVWVGTDGAGLLSIDPVSKKINTYMHNPLNKFSLKNNTVLSICEDKHQNIWVVTKGGEVQILPNSANQIKYYSGSKDNSPSRILSIFKDSGQNLWCGTDGKGLSKVTPEGYIHHFSANSQNPNGFPGQYIQTIQDDKEGNILIGTYLNGLWIYLKNSKTFQKINLKKSNESNVIDIRHLYRDKKDRIWVTTFNGLYVFSSDLQKTETFYSHKNGLYGDVSQSICEDNSGRLWIALNNGGLFALQEDQNNFSESYFQQHLYFDKNSADNHNYNITSMEFGPNNILWLITVSGALIRYDVTEQKFSSYKDYDAFKNISLSAIEIDDKNQLWLSSDNGIIQFNPETEEIEHYYQTDGLQGDHYLKRSSFKDAENNLYFGGSNGLDAFDPSMMEPKSSSAKLYFTDIDVLNQTVHKLVPDQVKNGINNIETIKLKYNQSSFSFRFSALDNLLNSNYHYAYRLKGFNDEWIVPNKELVGTFTNIKDGDYLFEVKAGTKKGIWDIPPKSIHLFISPPWWFSSWAYLVYLIISGLIFYYLYSWFSLNSKLRKEEWLHRKESEMYALKMNFFAKMSHEIQTPLTLILGPIEDLLRTSAHHNQAFLKKLKIISNNARRLSKITTELTSLRDKELGKFQLKVTKNNIIKNLKTICLSFEDLAQFKSIHFLQHYPTESLNIWCDSDKIEHVIYNLLFNAFKFTPRGGEVQLIVNKTSNSKEIKISIHDTGPGIPKDELDKIFGLFYQSKLGKKLKGEGIGLALAKEIVEMHHGNISVESTKGLGTKFTFTLPNEKSVFKENAIIEEPNFIGSEFHVSDSSPAHLMEEETKSILLPKSLDKESIDFDKTKTLLIVEDNHNMQIFLESVFEAKYHVIFADDGEKGIRMVNEHNPDLIISDVMMPNLNGIEMSKILHKQKFTQHIPIILMSAHIQENTKVRGLKTGAVEFIQKPFDIQELMLKVDNIIYQSDKIITRYKTNTISSPDNNNEMSSDEQFISNLVNAIQENSDNPNFKLESLSQSLNMSYSSIYRKCQAITGKSLVEYVRWIRIKKSIFLLINKGHSISEAAYLSGFNNPKYYTKCFKKEIGVSPNNLKKEASQKGIIKTMEKYNLENNQ
jgi:hypothetical protein